MIKGTLSNGFEYKLDEEKLNDWHVLKLISKAEKDAALFVDLVEAMLGEEQAEALATHLAVDGKTTVTAMEEAITEIFDEAGEQLKN